jgi:hypothetical protein
VDVRHVSGVARQSSTHTSPEKVAGGTGCAGRAMGTAEEREVKEEKEHKNVGTGRGLRQYALAKRRQGRDGVL